MTKKNQLILQEWRSKSNAALVKERQKMEDQLTMLKFRISLQKEKNTSLVRKERKSIARIHTIIHQEQNHDES